MGRRSNKNYNIFYGKSKVFEETLGLIVVPNDAKFY